MPQGSRVLAPERSARDMFGAELRHQRRQQGLSQAQLATLISFGEDLLCKVEKAERWPPPGLAEACDRALGTGGVLSRMWPYVDGERQRARQASRRHRSTEAVDSAGGSYLRVRALGVDLLVPVDTAACARLEPQARSTGELHTDVQRAQDVDPALVPHWTCLLRVLAASHNVFGPRRIHEVIRRESSVICRYRQDATGEVRSRLLGVEARWAEFASWTADNLGDHEEASYWLGRSLALATEAGDSSMAGYVLMRQAQQAAERLDAAQASKLADEASHASGLSARDRALCAVRQAQGRALLGDSAGTAEAIGAAYRLVARVDVAGADEDPRTIGVHCHHWYIQAHEGYCQLQLGRTTDAVRLLEEILADWPAELRQDECLVRAWLALAYAESGHIERAGAEGSKALSLTTSSWSARAIRTLGRLHRRLPGTTGVSEVEDFRAAYSLTTAVQRI